MASDLDNRSYEKLVSFEDIPPDPSCAEDLQFKDIPPDPSSAEDLHFKDDAADDFLTKSFARMSTVVNTELARLKNRVAAHHEGMLRPLEAELDRLKSVVQNPDADETVLALEANKVKLEVQTSPPMVADNGQTVSTDDAEVSLDAVQLQIGHAKAMSKKIRGSLKSATSTLKADASRLRLSKISALTLDKNCGPTSNGYSQRGDIVGRTSTLHSSMASMSMKSDMKQQRSNITRTSVQSLIEGRTSARSPRSFRSEQLQRTKKLFDRISLDKKTISARRAHAIMRIVNGPNCQCFEDIRDTIDRLYKASHSTLSTEGFPDGPHFKESLVWRTSDSGQRFDSGFFSLTGSRSVHRVSEMHYDLDFHMFARLLAWEELYSELDEDLALESFILRDALIKHGADLLIAYHARLEFPDYVVQKPLTMQLLDPVSAFVIILNSLTIGVSADVEWSGWSTFELLFTIFFAFEIIVKFCVNGWWEMMAGAEKYWNYFDISLVVIAIGDLFLQNLTDTSTGVRDFTLARLARLAKLTRLMRMVRLLRFKVFKELLLMVRGLFAGLRTLFWAIMLLVVLVYASSVALMETVGEADIKTGDKYGTVLFKTLLWSMFNVFRACMSEDSLPDGTSLVAILEAEFGPSFVIPYAFVKMFIVFGIFNLVAAIFVENVMASAKAKRELTEDGERIRVALALRRLLLKFCGHGNIDNPSARQSFGNFNSESGMLQTVIGFVARKLKTFSDGDEEFYITQQSGSHFEIDGMITRDMFDKAIRDKETNGLLDDLEIYCDRTELFDVLDADSSGQLDIYEMISGLMKMRSGGSDKSDSVATYLSLRSVQSTIREMKADFASMTNMLTDVRVQCEDIQRKAKPNDNNDGVRAKCNVIPVESL